MDHLATSHQKPIDKRMNLREIIILILALTSLANHPIIAIIAAVGGLISRAVDTRWASILAIGFATYMLPTPLNLLSIPIMAASSLYLRNMMKDLPQDLTKVILLIYLIGAIIIYLIGPGLLGVALLMYALFMLMRRGGV